MRVRHQGKVWEVLKEIEIDGVPAYELHGEDNLGGTEITAWASDCRPVKPRVRRIKEGRYVLESHSDGTLAVRRARSSKRYPLTLEQIYDLAVRLQVFKRGRIPKHLRARGRKR